MEDRILCRVLKKSNKAGRFRIVGTYEYSVKTNIGRVLKVGEDYTGDLKLGEYVVFQAWGGREFQSPDETLILLRPDNVLARVER